ncbi:hypothetical protein [Gimesia fumaroli]|uniref:Uncharacterized protein n=1 Tax=Gimesia fumaroli TaxID=2527976 RepID=A0A518I6B9_9PLAN|nr:hypothetical protein [Gimesia fumaroli]QDV48614.1 hypothetical protein Enr17x_06270 [Gimesia fumaroli]
MVCKIDNNGPHFLEFISETRLLFCTFVVVLLAGLPGCAHTDDDYDETCSTVSCRVKKSFLFHHDKCSPHPYRSLEGYQTDLDKYVVKHAARKCAKRSLKTMACNCKDKPSKAFRKGYQQAYIDIALGDSGEVPPVPPEEYWAAHYRTPQGYLEVQEWFTGYKLGAEHALADGRYDYNNIATPYSLMDWNQSAPGEWDENATYRQGNHLTEPTPQAAPSASLSSSHQSQTPQPQKVTLPQHPLSLPAPPAPAVPQHSQPKRKQTIPQKQPPQAQPALPPRQPRSQPPVVAPKPPLHVQKTIPAPTLKRHQPEIGKPSQPAYINDDPPPSPYKLQSYPYRPFHTPLPSRQAPSNQYQQRNQTNRKRLPLFSERQPGLNRY